MQEKSCKLVISINVLLAFYCGKYHENIYRPSKHIYKRNEIKDKTGVEIQKSPEVIKVYSQSFKPAIEKDPGAKIYSYIYNPAEYWDKIESSLNEIDYNRSGNKFYYIFLANPKMRDSLCLRI